MFSVDRPCATVDAVGDDPEVRLGLAALIAVRKRLAASDEITTGPFCIRILASLSDTGHRLFARASWDNPLLIGGTTYGTRPATETLALGFFPRRSRPAPRGRFAAKKPLARVRRCASPQVGFGGVARPITVSPSQGIGPCGNKGERP